MLCLSKEQMLELIERSRAEAPKEACGILAGKDGRVEKIYRMVNTDDSAKTFLMEPKQQLQVVKEMRQEGLVMVGIYHSHSETEAYPSSHDVRMAFYPDVSYAIVSLKDPRNMHIRSYRIVEGVITEEEVKLI